MWKDFYVSKHSKNYILVLFLLLCTHFDTWSCSGCSHLIREFEKEEDVLKAFGEKKKCHTVVLTVNYGAYDYFYPISPEWTAQKDTCFVYITDAKTRGFIEKEKARLGCRNCGWDVVYEKEIPSNSDRIVRSRIPKILPHLFFPEAEYFIWVDANKHLKFSPQDIISRTMKNSTLIALPYALMKKKSIQEEFMYVKRNRMVDFQRANNLLGEYKGQGLHQLRVLHGGFRIQRNTHETQSFGCKWYTDFLKCYRDQLSLHPILSRTGLANTSAVHIIDNPFDFFKKVDHLPGAHRKAWTHPYQREPKKQPRIIRSAPKRMDVRFPGRYRHHSFIKKQKREKKLF
mmetsp:Transcript_21063/g.59261  ORF Transcript_21063/g.59261 Transcript_21063/m.59261 type:complete len:343 (-) Transcript_21063:105-1133(-)